MSRAKFADALLREADALFRESVPKHRLTIAENTHHRERHDVGGRVIGPAFVKS